MINFNICPAIMNTTVTMYHPFVHMIVCNEQWQIPPAHAQTFHLRQKKSLFFCSIVDHLIKSTIICWDDGAITT